MMIYTFGGGGPYREAGLAIIRRNNHNNTDESLSHFQNSNNDYKRKLELCGEKTAVRHSSRCLKTSQKHYSVSKPTNRNSELTCSKQKKSDSLVIELGLEVSREIYMNHNEVERIVNDRINSLLLDVIFELKQEFSDDLRNEYNLEDKSS